MRLVLVNYGHDADLASAEALLDRYHTLTGWAESVAATGAEVTVVQGFVHDASLERSGVRYEMVAGSFAPVVARWRVPRRLLARVRRLRPQVVHLNGLLFPLQDRALRLTLPRRCRMVVQHHAERPRRGLMGGLQRWGLAAADGFIFTAAEQAEDWRRRGMIRSRQPVFEIAECPSRFRAAPREESRRRTGLSGEPVFLWGGHLDANKDPLTVLDGFETALAVLPRARLYMAFRAAPLLSAVQERLASSRALGASVQLLGEVDHDAMEAHLNSADYFLLGSRYEGGAGAVVEALACGVVPVVPDIAPLRTLTEGGRVGELWVPGDAADLARAIGRAVAAPLGERRRRVRESFERRLSYEAVGELAIGCYRSLLAGAET